MDIQLLPRCPGPPSLLIRAGLGNLNKAISGVSA
jgi:hypothetical protein